MREEAGLTLQQLAELTGYKTATLNGLELHDEGSDRLRQKVTEVLTPLRKEKPNVTESVKPRARPPGAGPYWGTSCTCPIISWASAGERHSYEDQGHDGPRIATDCLDPNCYALQIQGDSMSPIYVHGDVVVVAPNQEPQHGDLVIAKTSDDDVYFKRLEFARDRETIRLVSFNPNYPAMEFRPEDLRFLHPVYSVTRYPAKKFNH
jgi:SOS-response transcriptional repressor LexA